jgi:formylglycine-generating enzyme required for sulfatase activity
LTPKEAEALKDYDDPARIAGDIEDLIGKLRSKYSESVDPRLQGLFASGKHRVETILFLERFRDALEKRPGSGVPLHEILYPRYWPTPDGKRRSGFVARSGQGVPWEDLPVVGITLYEALGYALWMASLTGESVGLPNEAEYERAASWPRDAGEGMDPGKKDLFPWQGHRKENFHAFFGRIGEDLETFYAAHRAAYDQLMEDTSRPVGETERLYMLEGYGWHWTCDRLDDDEIRYSRFRDPGYRRYREDPEVFDYRPNTKLESTHFVLKGSPQILGGPGVTPRRYSAFPLRGYDNVGFRIAVR